MILIDLFVLFAHDHSTKIYDSLSFILFFARDCSTKIKDLIALYCSLVYTVKASLFYSCF